MEKTARQRIRYLRTADGVRLAWAEAGAGPVLIKAANWLTHLDYDWESPVWRHWIRFFCRHFRFVDESSEGMGGTTHPHYDMWVTADEDSIFVQGGVGGYMATWYELVELDR